LFGYKAAYESYVLLKDMEWSEQLGRFAVLLPDLQRGLPVPDEYKQETPGADSDLNAYDVIYYAGHSNAGSKTIAVNLPNDEQVQLEKGTRRLQLKNAMQAKFDEILVPIADLLIAEDQREHVTFDAFFSNVMFHEVAHGLGIKNTVSGRGTVREAMQPSRTTTHSASQACSRPCASAPRARTAARTWRASTSSPSMARSRAIPIPGATAWITPECARPWTHCQRAFSRRRVRATT